MRFYQNINFKQNFGVYVYFSLQKETGYCSLSLCTSLTSTNENKFNHVNKFKYGRLGTHDVQNGTVPL